MHSLKVSRETTMRLLYARQNKHFKASGDPGTPFSEPLGPRVRVTYEVLLNMQGLPRMH